MTDSLEDNEPSADPVLPTSAPAPGDPGIDLVKIRISAGHALGGIVYTVGDIIETPLTEQVRVSLATGLSKEIE